MGIASLKERISSTEQTLAKSRQEGKRLSKEIACAEGLIAEKQQELKKVKFDPEHFAQLSAAARQGEQAWYQMQERLDSLRAHLAGVDFHYADPYPGFNRSAVKGAVAQLFHIKSDFAQYHRALEVCAGGRLFFVVVDNEQTGKALLEKGQLRRRVTIIPLNKIVDHTIPNNTVRQAKSVMPAGGDLHLAMQIIGCQPEVERAMKYVFGGFLVCDSAQTAKQVTFHPDVRVRSVTKDGDLYDPAGTITGGSAPKGGNILQKLQELGQLEQQVFRQQHEYEQMKTQLQKMQSTAQKYNLVESELKCKEHEFELIKERISRSEHHAAEQALQEMRKQLSQLEEELANLPDEKKRLEKAVKQFEKEIKTLDSSREERIKHFEEQIEHLKATAKQHVEKLEKQREKTEQVQVELEVMNNEIAAQDSKEQDSGKSGSNLEGEVTKLKETYEAKKNASESLGAKLEAMREELKNLDEKLGTLSTELTSCRQQREEKELEQKRLNHKMQQLTKDDKEAHLVVGRMEKQHAWIEKEKTFFGKAGTDFDFEANNYQENKARLDEMGAQQKNLGKNINKKAMAMFEKAEQEYKDLLQKRDIILNDKCKIEAVIRDLDERKGETLRRTWMKVNADFNSIFGTLLPHTCAKLEAPQGMSEIEGLEIKVGFNGVWKQSLTELSGGQRSLLALSLVLALLLFKPAPMYILDEIDSALDLSHTQNIGHMIRTHFPHSQFIIVSLKEGMFNHANVLFRTRFIDGTSTVARYAIRDADGAEGKENTVPGGEPSRKKKKVA